MKHFFCTLPCFVIILMTAFNTQAGIVINGTRVIYSATRKEAAISISNEKNSGIYLVQSWVGSDKEGKKTPFIVTPPLFRINPGEENILRIINTSNTLPEDRESVFWLNVKSIPATSDSTPAANRLQVVVKSRLKLFYRPVSLTGQQNAAWKQLSIQRRSDRLVIRNPTSWYVTLYTLKVNGLDIPAPDMIPPKSSVSIHFSAPSVANVTWQAINDYGGITPQEHLNLQG